MTPAAYQHPDYAASLGEFGEPLALPRCGGWLLRRAIPGSAGFDAMGCYPLFSCADWAGLAADLDELKDRLVSVALVADPFGEYDLDYLRRCFPDRVVPFKEHFVTELVRPPGEIISKHHRYYVKKARERIEVEVCPDPPGCLDEWTALYAALAERHGLRGLKAFSRAAFARQLAVPGLTMFRARSEGETVGAHLWYAQGEVAYSHLAAFSPRGYDLMASYALYAAALEFFAGRARWLEIGGSAGSDAAADDGLTRFKRGWSTGTRPAYFCGRIFQAEVYAELGRGRDAGAYFPAYRAGEF